MLNVVAYGIDYLRFGIKSDLDLRFIQQRLEYVDVYERWFHGHRYVDLTGQQLGLIRMVEDLDKVILELAYLYRVSRIDVFCDVEGYLLLSVKRSGTVISNNGRVETVYSHHLGKRGDYDVFARVYDAEASGHYESAVTRFECEFKRHHARTLLSVNGWTVNPIGNMLHCIRLLFGTRIEIPGIAAIEYNAPKVRLEHSRERFYKRFGQSIMRDIETMGVGSLHSFIRECLANKRSGTSDE